LFKLAVSLISHHNDHTPPPLTITRYSTNQPPLAVCFFTAFISNKLPVKNFVADAFNSSTLSRRKPNGFNNATYGEVVSTYIGKTGYSCVRSFQDISSFH
jgi:hypothetical protein